MRLNIGDNNVMHQGYEGVDIKRGQSALSLAYQTSTVEEVRASHILEHFDGVNVRVALKEWYRVLKPGGLMKIAVPDFKVVAKAYLDGHNLPFQGYIMGGHVDEHDVHKVIFDAEILTDLLKEIGLVGIRHWTDDFEDCSSLPISLNLCGTKPPDKWPTIAAVISMPRLGFNDMWACAYRELSPIMPLRKVTGAYWDRDLTAAIEESLNDHNPEWILTLDYDTCFTRDQIYSLLDLATRFPNADAIAPLQTARHHTGPMFTARNPDTGELIKGMNREDLEAGSVMRSETAHFGLTLLRTSKLKTLPQPWFNRTYGPNGCDPDVQFWHNWKAAGNTLYTALRVPVGHMAAMVRWPDLNLGCIFQETSDFQKHGAPEGVWR